MAGPGLAIGPASSWTSRGPPPVCQTPHGLRVNSKYIIGMFKRVTLCTVERRQVDTVRIGDTLRDEHRVM